MFSREYCEIFRNSFFIEHLWWLLLYCHSRSYKDAVQFILRFSLSVNPNLGANGIETIREPSFFQIKNKELGTL